MLVDEKFNRVYYKDIVEAIFSTSDRAKAESIIEDYFNYWKQIVGTRGYTGKRTQNAHSIANELEFPESPDYSNLKPEKKPTEPHFNKTLFDL